ncbi:MAG TPA: RNA polymerase sigma factor [Pyrinomonadaceae bacterium]|nr:RNA polymerase sigma factor [Pyrinomonadaceae bacterium]
MPDRDSEGRLLERASGGDQAAFLELYERHRQPVFRFAYRLLGSMEMAEDITHDCFLGLIRKPANFDPSRASLRTYLYGAARNLVMKQFRSAGRESALDDLLDDPLVPEREAPLRRVLDQELSAIVKEAVFMLPPLQREALVLFEYEGLSLAEIAVVVGSDIGAVKARLHRARERLRRALQPYLNSSQEIVTLKEA